MSVLSVVPIDKPLPMDHDLLMRALRNNDPEALPIDRIQRLESQDWVRPLTLALDLDMLAKNVLQHLTNHRSPPLSQGRASPPVPTLLPRRRGTTAWAQPHALAWLLAKARHDERWHPLARHMLSHRWPDDAVWSWGWVWALPQAVQASLWSDADHAERFAGRLATAVDSDGLSLWEALVQPHAWTTDGAERLRARFGLASKAFAGGLGAAWRVNNVSAQRWWLAVHPASAVPDELDAWRASRTAQAQISQHALHLEQQMLDRDLLVTTSFHRRRL